MGCNGYDKFINNNKPKSLIKSQNIMVKLTNYWKQNIYTIRLLTAIIRNQRNYVD